MKTTFLISGMLLLSAALSAQTTMKNNDAIKDKTSIQSNKGGSNMNSTESASSAIIIQSKATQKAKSRSYDEIKKENEAVATEKQTLMADAKTKEQQTKKMASQDHSAFISAHSNAHAHAFAEGNNYNDNTSVNGSAKVSSFDVESRSNQVKNQEKANIKAQVDATAENSSRVKANVAKKTIKEEKRINTASSATVKAGVASAHAIHPRPISVKTRTMVRTNGGINIK